MNEVILMGRLVRNPEVRYNINSEEDKAVAKYTLAVYRNERHTEFVPCVSFGKSAELIERSLKKGSLIVVVGSLHIKPTDYEDGTRSWWTEIIVNKFYFGESREAAEARAAREEG